MAKEIDLSIVVVSFNTRVLTLECIESVYKHTNGVSFELIVVDNASSDGSVDAIKKVINSKHRDIRLKVNKENLGFAEANNQGARLGHARYLLLLNSDTRLTSNVLKRAVNWMDDHPKAGIYSCGLRNKDGSVQTTGGFIPSLPRVLAWMLFLDDIPVVSNLLSSYHPKVGFYRKEKYLDWVTGAFFLTRAQIWDKLGGFDTGYFMYVEEVDFCFRAKKMGIKVFYDPQHSIIHYGGASSKSNYPIVSEYKGLKIFYKKYFPPWQYWGLRFMLKIGAVVRMVLFGVLRGLESFKIYAEAYQIA